MKVYVVMVESLLNGLVKVSQEGYKSLKEAQIFCVTRSDKPWKISNYKYGSEENTYIITEVAIKE